MSASLVGSEMCIRDSRAAAHRPVGALACLLTGLRCWMGVAWRAALASLQRRGASAQHHRWSSVAWGWRAAAAPPSRGLRACGLARGRARRQGSA
eukprot:10406673-Alexandrium_andersonii.AAC.1